MKIIDSNSLYKTLDNLNQRFLNNVQLTLKERKEVAHWISDRQGLKGTYAGMPAPAEKDFKGIKLFTGEYINSKASIGHILGEESLRALYLLNINDDKTNKVITGFKSGLYKAIKKQYSMGRYADGTFCCGKCTAALWRNLSAEGVKKNKKSLVSGINYLKSHRDGKGKYKRFPFFYTILALSGIDLPEAKAEIEYASELLRRYVKELSTILIPFVLAVIISFMFEPFFIWMKSKKVPQALAIVVILITIIIIANIASVFIVASIDSFSANFKVYEEKFHHLINSIIVSMNISSQDLQKINDSLKISSLLQQGSLTTFIANFLTGFIGIFGDFLIILFYVIFILSELGNIKERVKVAFKDRKAESITRTMDTIFKDVRTYILGKTIISLILGITSGFVLWIFGVDFFVIWGFLIFIAHYIPNIGAVVSITIPGIFMFLQFESFLTPVVVIITLAALDNLIGNILEPKILGDKLNLSPLVLLLSLFMGEYVWGIVGMILSVPIVSMLKIVMMNFESTKPFAILMSYKPSVIRKNLFD